MKKYLHNECCLTCDAFCFWDGDYCCSREMKIHQFGWCPYNPGAIWFTDDIDKTMETPETCKEYSNRHHKKYPLKDNEYLKEYKKFVEWQRLRKQLYDHVNP